MALFNIFKKKKPRLRRNIEGAPQASEKTEEKKPVAVKTDSRKAALVLKTPLVAEKATDLAKLNQYVFKIYPENNKSQVKEAVEGFYGVKVLKVNIVNLPAKQRRLGKTLGWKPGFKKAIVKIKQGQKIEVLPR